MAQLLQIEEVRLKSSRRCGFSQSPAPHAQEASILLVFYTIGGGRPRHQGAMPRLKFEPEQEVTSS